VRELSAAELAHLDDELIRLDELLPWAANAPIDLLVEIKEPDVALVVATMVAESTWCEHVTIGGFHGPALAAIKTLVPRIRTSFMMGSVAGGGELLALARACRADGIHLCWDGRATHPHRLLDDALHVCLRGAGLDITLWHEEREGELQALVAWQPDAICTDTPARLRRIVNAHCAMGSKLNT
jgi:glycerophosphoryl diester phosphodiesterase